jgi:hypothetical protein
MVIQGEGNSSVVENPTVNPPDYDAITQAFIMNQLQGQMMNRSPIGTMAQRPTMSPKRVQSQKRQTPFTRRIFNPQ